MRPRALAVAIGLLGALVVAACSKERIPSAEKDGATGPVGATGASSADAQAKWDEMVPKPEEAPTLPASWTDPTVVAALAERCDFTPTLPLPPNAGDLRRNRFLCAKGATPRAADAGPDLCWPYRAACETRCKGQCESCGRGCVGACATCIQACSAGGSASDCRKACATTCAGCRETCTTKWESCDAADCTREHDACAGRLASLWEKNDCATRCRTYGVCTARCSGPDTGKCLAKCKSAVAPALPACLDKCTSATSPERESCEVKCYESAPCAPALCKDPPGAR
jgi:hypothetical protein